jgi:hypothetical protein
LSSYARLCVAFYSGGLIIGVLQLSTSFMKDVDFCLKGDEIILALQTEKKFSLPPGFRIRIHLIRIRIQHFGLNTDPDPMRIQGFYDQKLEKNLQLKKKNLDLKLQFTYP